MDRILKPMETEAEKIFEAGLTQAEKAYSDTFEEEKGGVGTWLTTWGDDWKDLIERSLAKARREYLRQVDDALVAGRCIEGVDHYEQGLDLRNHWPTIRRKSLRRQVRHADGIRAWSRIQID